MSDDENVDGDNNYDFLLIIGTIYLILLLITGYFNPIGQYCVIYQEPHISNKINDYREKIEFNKCGMPVTDDRLYYCNGLKRDMNFYVEKYNNLICVGE